MAHDIDVSSQFLSHRRVGPGGSMRRDVLIGVSDTVAKRRRKEEVQRARVEEERERKDEETHFPWLVPRAGPFLKQKREEEEKISSERRRKRKGREGSSPRVNVV